MSPPRSLPEAPIFGLVRLTFRDALRWWEAQACPLHPADDLGAFPFVEIMVYPDLVLGPPAAMSPELREAIIAAVAESLVSAYRREHKNA
jgi:hypothetical protein